MHQRLSARKDDPLNIQPAYIFEMTSEVIGRDLISGAILPDVAHYTPAIAAPMWVQNQNRHGRKGGVHAITRLPARHIRSPRTCFVAARNSRMLLFTNHLPRPSIS